MANKECDNTTYNNYYNSVVSMHYLQNVIVSMVLYSSDESTVNHNIMPDFIPCYLATIQ